MFNDYTQLSSSRTRRPSSATSAQRGKLGFADLGNVGGQKPLQELFDKSSQYFDRLTWLAEKSLIFDR